MCTDQHIQIARKTYTQKDTHIHAHIDVTKDIKHRQAHTHTHESTYPYRNPHKYTDTNFLKYTQSMHTSTFVHIHSHVRKKKGTYLHIIIDIHM